MLAALLATALAGAVALIAGWPPAALERLVGAAPTPTPSVGPEPAPGPVLAALAQPPAAAPTAAGVNAALAPVLASTGLGTAVGVSVVDVATGAELYDAAGDRAYIPASTTKLVTAATVLATRGPSYRLRTTAVAGVRPGEVVLVGGGDPTLAAGAVGAYAGAARLDRLAAQVSRSLGGVRPSRVVLDVSLFAGEQQGPGWDAGIVAGGHVAPITALMTDGGRLRPRQGSPAARHTAPDLAAGRRFAQLIGAPPTVVTGTAPAPPVPAPGNPVPAPGSPFAAPAPGTLLGAVASPPMQRLVDIMLADSDNVLAEALARQVALARDQPASYAGASSAMDAVLTELGLPADESGLVDGSGLSRSNALTPTLLTDLVALIASGRTPALSGLFNGLPVAGWSGTLEDRFRAPSGAGRAGLGVVRAKTGTLSGVSAMAGVVTTADGRLLAFSLLANDTTLPPYEAPAALDAVAAALARCGCR
ncbi:D-alanyl-D-alanine carboxypeptidase/D-alanyl-D-alanine endopeptidase [Pilimelia columellifera]|uniref:D-alanyl-D-alanine carboxypeptidase/D-alanyl-D-alanine endopeptidase n=1 Tax=Pilimelia columellifera TaxID=706574 RepID=UPI003CD07777